MTTFEAKERVKIPDEILIPLKRAIERAGGVCGVLIVAEGTKAGDFKVLSWMNNHDDAAKLIKCAHDANVLERAQVGGSA